LPGQVHIKIGHPLYISSPTDPEEIARNLQKTIEGM
jgi:hypothetical protein